MLSALSGFLAAGVFMATALSLAERDPAHHRRTQLRAPHSNDQAVLMTTCLIFFGTMKQPISVRVTIHAFRACRVRLTTCVPAAFVVTSIDPLSAALA
jgi:hypothetical protein